MKIICIVAWDAAGSACEPKSSMKDEDVAEVEVERIGVLSNPVVAG